MRVMSPYYISFPFRRRSSFNFPRMEGDVEKNPSGS
jgi:hypothetical protein